MSLKQYIDTKLALGCDTTLTLVTDLNKEDVIRIFNILWLEVFRFEKRFSRFLPESELSKFNRNAGNETKISSEFENLLRVSNEMSEKTNGYHNPFVLPALHRFGYEKSFVSDYASDSFESHSADLIVGYKNLEITAGYAKIPKNTSIDLGNQLFAFSSAINSRQQQNLEDRLKAGQISEQKYAKEIAELKRKQAVADKKQAAFNISISTAIAI